MRHIRQLAKGFVAGYLALAAVAALVEQLRLPPPQRTWHGQIAGIPYEFRRPTLARTLRAWWNPQDARLIVPRGDFGLGWAVNVYRLTHASPA